MIGKTVSHYKIISKLGEGGMGVVYKAEDTRLERHVAIKFLPSSLSSDSNAKKRFIREAKAASALNHANIAVVHEIDETPDGQMFMVMAYYEGRTLKDRLESGPLRVNEAIEIVSQIASGLAKAHEKGILHRDIKPANILIGDDGQAKLADFGLATLTGQTRITRTGTTVGTVAYMSPEQASGSEVDRRSDLFSLGAVFYEMLTGRLPFPGDHEAAVLYGVMNSEPDPLVAHRENISSQLQHIVDRALAKKPVSRYQTALDMQSDIELIRDGTVAGSPGQRRMRYRRGAALFLVTALVLFGGYAGTKRFWYSKEIPSWGGETSSVSVAVLPFVNVSSDLEQEYFSDGLTEELISVLARIPELRVTGRTSSFVFKGVNEDLRTIGQKLGVEHILEGSVRKAGDEVKVTAQLIDVSSGFNSWSDSYNVSLDDIFGVQEDIAKAVAQQLGAMLLGEQSEPDPEAHDLAMRARFVLREERTQQGIRRARTLVEQALAIDSSYASAWALMGSVLDLERGSASSIDAQHAILDTVRTVYERALALEPGLATTHVGKALNVHLENWEFEEAEKSIELALQLDPGDPSVMRGAAFFFWAIGRFDRAIALGEDYLKTEPLDRGSYVNLAHAYRGAGLLERAEAVVRKGQELWPQDLHGILARIFLSAGHVDEAREAWNRAVEESHPGESMALFFEALIEYSAGDTTSAANALAEFEGRYGASRPTSCARIRGWRGESQAAFGWLDNAYAVRDPALAYLKQYVELQQLRSDPRWRGLVAKVGLPPD